MHSLCFHLDLQIEIDRTWKKIYNTTMAKVTFLTIPIELEQAYWSGLQPGDRFIIPRIRAKNLIITKAKKQKIKLRSLLPQIRDLWNAMTTEQRASWKAVDFHPRKHGWREFVADQTQRILLELPGTATPNIYHQDKVGEIYIEAPATGIKLIQPHPYAYWILKRVAGKKAMYEPTPINEKLYLPLKIGISTKSDLVAAGPNPSAKFYADVKHLYQGQNLQYNLEIDIPLISAWQRQTNTLSVVIGQAIMYNLYLELVDVQGTLLFDDVEATHAAQNWARDIYCKNVVQSFTHGFYQVPKAWAVEIMPIGADYDSVYPE